LGATFVKKFYLATKELKKLKKLKKLIINLKKNVDHDKINKKIKGGKP
jgi:hypothetical protein